MLAATAQAQLTIVPGSVPPNYDLTGVTSIDAVTTTIVAHGSSGASEDFSALYGVHSVTLDQATTFTLSNFSATDASSITIWITQDGTGSRVITWPVELLNTPTINPAASSITRVNIATINGGTSFVATSDYTPAAGLPVSSKSANYTLVLSDANTTILHPVGDNNARTFTIPANASVAFPVGTTITIVNMAVADATIAITTDTMNLAGAGTTGSRTLAQFGVCVAIKITSTIWLISGTNLTRE